MAGLGLAAVAPVTEARAAAAPGAPHIALSAYTGPPGTAIRVSGSGFATRETVRISLDDQDHTVAHANRRGSFSGALVKVGSVGPGAYQVTAVGRRTGRQASATFTVHDNWAQYGAGPARTGWNGNEFVLSPSAVPGLGLAWRFDTGNEAFSSPAVVNGTAYVGSLNNAVYALNAATGTQRWMFRTDGAVNSSPAVLGGKAYVGSEGNRVYAIGVVHGVQRWVYRTGAPVFGSPAVLNGTVYVAAVNGTVYAFNAATGKWRWRVRLRTEVAASVAVANGVVYVPAEPGELYALSAATGARLWHALLPGYAVSAPAVANGVVYLGTDHTDVGDLLAFNAATGKRIWDIQDSNGAVDAAPAVAAASCTGSPMATRSPRTRPPAATSGRSA